MAEGNGENSSAHSKDRNSKGLRTISLTRESNERLLPLYFRIEHKENLRKPNPWSELLEVVRTMRVDSKTAPYSLQFLREIFRLFKRYRCEDAALISEVFLYMLLLSSNDFEQCDNISEDKYKLLCMPYGTENEGDLAWNAARSGNLGLLKLQLKLGVIPMKPTFTKDSGLHYCHILLRLRPDDFDIDRMGFEIIYEHFLGNIDPGSSRRLCLVLRVLEIVDSMKFCLGYTRHFVDSYRLLFDSTPEPYVTSVEVETSLEKCLPDTCSSLIYRASEDFKTLLPELAKVPEPRSLLHLCRIQARQNLRQAVKLPHGVSALNLPTKLKDYIMLDDDSDCNTIIGDILKYNWWRDYIVSSTKAYFTAD